LKLEPELKAEFYQKWMDGRVKVMYPTNAFVMGINKPGNYDFFEMMMIKNSASFEIFV
jgi:hypothetical protein